jgi:endonuclease/exonuclease/phosphatase family metal-dependent hydrolase
MQLSLATYNIHRCIGLDGRRSAERIAEVLCELDADVVVLQEVESPVDNPMGLLNYLARQTNSEPFADVTMVREDAHYGNAVLTRLPVRWAKRHDLSIGLREPRGAQEIELDFGGCRMHLIATHLGLRPGERRRQVRRLLPLFDTPHHDICVLAGDLNEWFLWGRPLRWLYEIFPHMPAVSTFPARWPFMALDRIWIRPRELLRSLSAHITPLSQVASDHLPLKAVFDLPEDFC